MTGRRAVFWCLLLLFLGGLVWWTLYVPYRPGLVFTAVPANATFVSVHEDLGGRWELLASQPLLGHWLTALGVPAEEQAKWRTDPQVARWLRRLAGRELVIAYVPELGHVGRPAWVFASWIGSRSRRLQWQLRWWTPPDLTPQLIRGEGLLWTSQTRFTEPRLRLSLALADGLLLGCLSTDPQGVRWLLETADGYPWRPSLATARTVARVAPLWVPQLKDRGWVALPLRAGAAFAPSLVAWSADLSTGTRIEGCLAADQPWPVEFALRDVPGASKLAALLGDTADVLAVLPLEHLAALEPPAPPPWLMAARSLWEAAGPSVSNRVALLAVLKRDYSGRIRGPLGRALTPFLRGLRVPTVVLALPVKDEADAAARVRAALDRLNLGYGLGLIPHPVPFTPQTITVIEESRNNFYGQFELDERAAFAVANGWLVLCSNALTLKRLLTEANVPRVLTTSPRTAWWQSDATAWLAVDLPRTCRSVKDTLAAASLALLVREPQQSLPVRRMFAEIQAWADALAPLGAVVMRSGHTPQGTAKVDVTIETARPVVAESEARDPQGAGTDR